MINLVANKVYFAYIIPKNFSGQSAATDLIISSLTDNQWDCIKLPLFPVNRTIKNIFERYLIFIFNSIKIFPVCFDLLITKSPVLYINLGQSIPSFIRILWWYLPIRFLKRNLSVVVSLHGHSFVEWSGVDLRSKLFIWILNSSKVVTVLGVNQKRKLEEFGVKEQNVIVVPNTCDLNVITKEDLKLKHKNPSTINLLYLSLLVESKGFPEYLEALELIALGEIQGKISAVLCGTITLTTYCKRFSSSVQMENWINEKIKTINQINPEKLTVRWIPGARGEEKETLFRDAHVFVLPTYYPNEAQPLVLIEALASGCAILTTKAGEISSTLNDKCAIFLDDVKPSLIESELTKLANSSELRMSLCTSGIDLMNSSYSIDQYARTWSGIFNAMMPDANKPKP